MVDARLAMDFAANDDKLRYDSKHRFVEFEVTEKLYLRLHKEDELSIMRAVLRRVEHGGMVHADLASQSS
jgi:hypothetical protein